MTTKGLLGRLMLAGMLMTYLAAGAMATTVSKTFTTHSTATAALMVYGGETLTYAVSGTFVGRVKLQKSHNGADYKDVVGYSTNAVITYTVPVDEALGRRAFYRIYCSTHTSGSIVTSLADVNDPVQIIKNHKGVDTFVLNDDGIAGASLADGAVVTAKLASDSVVTAKIANGAITSAKLQGMPSAPAGAVVCLKAGGGFGYCSATPTDGACAANCN